MGESNSAGQDRDQRVAKDLEEIEAKLIALAHKTLADADASAANGDDCYSKMGIGLKILETLSEAPFLRRNVEARVREIVRSEIGVQVDRVLGRG